MKKGFWSNPWIINLTTGLIILVIGWVVAWLGKNVGRIGLGVLSNPWIISIAAGLISIFIGWVAICVRKKNKKKRRKMAEIHINNGNYLCDSGWKTNPPTGDWRKGEEYFNKAIGEFKKALEIDPKSASAHSGLSNALRGLGWFKRRDGGDWILAKDLFFQAIGLAKRATELQEDYVEAYHNWGESLESLGWLARDRGNIISLEQGIESTREAIQKYEKILRIDPDYKSAKVWLDRAKDLLAELESHLK